MSRILPLVAFALLACSCTETARHVDASVATLTDTCAGLKGRTLDGVMITATRRLEPSSTSPTGLCQVLATRAPFLDIEVDVPDGWSGRLLHQGGAGFDGRIPAGISLAADGSIASVNAAISQKAAIYVASNGGNRAQVSAEAAPDVWANGMTTGKDSADDYAARALGTTIKFAKEIARAFFSRAPNHTYFNGCSNGGRAAYIVAERWPDEYDGIVSGCETMDMTGQTAALLSLGSIAGTPAALTPGQYTAAFSAALSACDADDGIVDGVLSHPTACKFDPAALRCGSPAANVDSSLCLSSTQVATLRGILSNLTLNNGVTVYAGYSWADFGVFSSFTGRLGGAFAFLATDNASWLTPPKQATFDLNRDYPVLRAGLRKRGADHDKAAIAAYVASGKKLISWHAGSDNLLSLNDHIRNYVAMTGLTRALGITDPRSNTRFFVVPGATHGVGATFTEVDWLSAIIDWVEKGIPPTQLVYSFSARGVTRTLPVCEYPSYPRYNGTGARNSASSFTCTRP